MRIIPSTINIVQVELGGGEALGCCLVRVFMCRCCACCSCCAFVLLCVVFLWVIICYVFLLLALGCFGCHCGLPL